MPRFDGGFIKVDRRCIFGDIGQRGYFTLGLWVRLLGMAVLQRTRILWNGKPRDLEPGQILTGLPDLALSDSVADTQQVRRSLEFLEKRQTIRQETGSRGRIITICNWSSYYRLLGDVGSLPAGSATFERQSGDSLATGKPQLIEEVKEVKKEKKERKNTARIGIRATYSPEFESLWEHYGRVGKKSDASEVFTRLALTPEELAELRIAITHYLAECRALNRFVMYFGTFLRNDWSDYKIPRVAPDGSPIDPEIAKLHAQAAEEDRGICGSA